MTGHAASPARPGAVLVTGVTGTTGSRVAARLTAAGERVHAASRRATPVPGAEAVRFDWYEPDTYAAALDGVDRVYLVAPPGDPEPATVVLPFLRQARDAGVRRAVLLSSSALPAGGPALGQIHQALPGIFDEWAVLRPSWFMQNFVGTQHTHALDIREHGSLHTASGDGRIGFVDADDIAAVAVHALTAEREPCTDLLLTGPEALSHDDIAAILTEATGRQVVHQRLSAGELGDRHHASGVPREFADLLARLDLAIAEGAEDRVTDTVERLTGRPPRTFRALLHSTSTPDAPGSRRTPPVSG